jgi:protein-disulfide isomerase
MPSIRRRTLLLSAAGVALAGAAWADMGQPAADDITMGSPKARVHFVEYASLSCPHCAAFHREVFPAFKAKYIDTGKVRYTLKEVLTQPRQFAGAGFLLARCAGPSRYYKVVGEMFDGLSLIQMGASPQSVLLSVGKANGMDPEQVGACLTDEGAVRGLNAREQRSSADGVRATPTFVMNGKVIGQGSITMAELDAAVAAALKR